MKTISKANLLKIIIAFILAQPLLDLVTSLMVRFSSLPITLGIIIRALFLIGIVFYYIFFFKSKHKKKVIIYMAGMALFFILFLAFMIITKENSVLFTEIKSVFKMFYFPILLVCLFDIFTTYKEHIDTKYITVVALVYFALILLPLITALGFPSYRYNRLGTSGWFYATNETGTILGVLFGAILFPVLARFKKSNVIKTIILSIIVLLSIFLAYNIGTKVPMLCVLLVLGMAIVVSLINLILRRKKAVKVFLLLVAFMAAAIVYIPFSPIGHNLNMHFSAAGVSSIGDFFDDDTVEVIVEEGTGENTPDNSKNVIYSSRDIFNAKTKQIFMQSSTAGKLVGLGFNSKLDGEDYIVSVEMDFHDLIYRYGIIGSIIWICPLLVALFVLLKKFFKHPLRYLDSYYILMSASGIVLTLLIGYMSGHVFTAPAVSIYAVVFIVNLQYYMSIKDKEFLEKNNE